MTDVKNIIEGKNIQEDKNSCQGRIYRFSESQYYSSYKSFETRKSMRPLKKESCPGCEKCAWVDAFLQDEIDYHVFNNYLNNCVPGKKYKLKFTWHPGSYEYPDEGELEAEFIEI